MHYHVMSQLQCSSVDAEDRHSQDPALESTAISWKTLYTRGLLSRLLQRHQEENKALVVGFYL